MAGGSMKRKTKSARGGGLKRSSRRGVDGRALADLAGVGRATLEDFRKLGISSVAALKKQSPTALYVKLCGITGVRQDPCVLDVFSCAIAQARNPALPAAQRNWWYWSARRKAGVSGRRSRPRPS
jgi:hypothetical protein